MNTINPISTINNEITQAIVLQAYCSSALHQPDVDFSAHPGLVIYQQEINNLLMSANTHANVYLNTIQPAIIDGLTNFSNFYNLYSAAVVALPPGATTAECTMVMEAIQQQANSYGTASANIEMDLAVLQTGLAASVPAFQSTIQSITASTNSDYNIVQATIAQAAKTDAGIASCITNALSSALGVVGEAITISVGPIADFTVSGATMPLVLGGVAIQAGTVPGVNGPSAATLKSFYDQRVSLLQQGLVSEINLLIGILSAYQQLTTQAQSVLNAAMQIKNTWTTLSANIAQTISDLQNGSMDSNALRTALTNAANTVNNQVLSNINILKAQIGGVNYHVLPAGINLETVI